ncbi:hypothetical protein [Shewanella marisflavi]|uniref:hypothetical protein n=1 Tax=Shewanella marisflavi TaxID=260364 RepID=UPI003AADC8E2
MDQIDANIVRVLTISFLINFFITAQEGTMSSDNATEENLISLMWRKLKSKATYAMQLTCLFAILSTYLFVMLKPGGIHNNKALGGH